MILSTTRRLRATSVIVIWLIQPLFLFSCYRDSPATEDSPARAATVTSPREEVVRFTDGQTTLEGTLFRPAEETDSPAVVILAGSDRSGRGPLRMRIAEHFARHNVAALVYDSPGTGNSTGSALLQTRSERAREALSAVDYLQTLPGIRSTSVGLFGGSEGADVALSAAASNSNVAFVVAVSGAMGVSILDVLRYSAEKEGHKQGLTIDKITKAITFKEIAFAFLSGVEIVEWPLIEARVSRWDDEPWDAFMGIAKRPRNDLSRQQKEELLGSFRRVIDRFKNDPWFSTVDPGNAIQRLVRLDVDNFFRLLDAKRYADDWDRSLCDVSGITCPVLAIWGQEDSFLPPNQSAMRLKKALADSNHPDYEVKVFANGSHFLTVPGSTTEFVPGYLDTMTLWLDRHVGAGTLPNETIE